MNPRLVVGMTGASGAAYGVRLLEVLLATGRSVDLSISPSGAEVIAHELGLAIDLDDFRSEQLVPGVGRDRVRAPFDRYVSLVPRGVPAEEKRGTLTYHHYQDLRSKMASGSAPSAGMVICPCSQGTTSAIAAGSSGNLIQRAADVHLKERRKLILVPRETPLSLIQIENLRRCTEAGAVILPAMPGFYHQVQSVGDLVDFVVARICDQLGVPHGLVRPWGS